MPHTTSIGNIVYSVDMMLSYINTFKPKYTKYKLNEINYDWNNKGWGDGDISVNNVLANKKKYKLDYDRIMNANLKYPIIIDNKGIMIDEVHRYIKAKLLDKKTINVYIFDTKLLKRFIIDTNGNYNIKLETYECIDLFIKRFYK